MPIVRTFGLSKRNLEKPVNGYNEAQRIARSEASHVGFEICILEGNISKKLWLRPTAKSRSSLCNKPTLLFSIGNNTCITVLSTGKNSAP